MQARYAFRKFEGTDRLQNIRYQQICMHDNIDIHLHFQKKYASSSKPPVLANLYTRRCLIPKICPRSSKPPVPANLHTRQVYISQNMCYYQSSKPPVPANLHARQVFISQNISSSSSSKTSCTVKFACKYTPPIQSNSFLKISGLF